MKTIVRKISANTSTTLFTGKGINNSNQTSILKLNINNLIITGAEEGGDITITLEAFDNVTSTNKSITLGSNIPTFKGLIQTIIPSRLSFTDSYSINIISTKNCTVMLELETKIDDKFVADFKTDNE